MGADGKELDGAALETTLELGAPEKTVEDDIGDSVELGKLLLFNTGVDEGTELPVPTGPIVLELAKVVNELGTSDEDSG